MRPSPGGEATIQCITPWVVCRTAPSLSRCAHPVPVLNIRRPPTPSAEVIPGIADGAGCTGERACPRRATPVADTATAAARASTAVRLVRTPDRPPRSSGPAAGSAAAPPPLSAAGSGGSHACGCPGDAMRARRNFRTGCSASASLSRDGEPVAGAGGSSPAASPGPSRPAAPARATIPSSPLAGAVRRERVRRPVRYRRAEPAHDTGTGIWRGVSLHQRPGGSPQAGSDLASHPLVQATAEIATRAMTRGPSS